MEEIALNKKFYEVAKKIEKIAIIPVIKLDKIEDVEPLGRALIAGGLRAAEITFRTNVAKEAILIMRDKFPELFIGAGTILTPKQAQDANDAGAGFLVSPGFNPRVVDYCIANDIVIYPGVNSPTGIEMALERGLNILKFFPAEASGGITMVSAIGAPYGRVKFIATGGINSNNIIPYLNSPYIIACGGSWMVSSELINSGKFDEIEGQCRSVVNLINKWRRNG